WYLRLLRDETKAAERMAHVLASSRYATGLLLRAPEAVAIFGNDAELNPRSLTGLRAEMMAAIQRYEDDAEGAVTAVRAGRGRGRRSRGERPPPDPPRSFSRGDPSPRTPLGRGCPPPHTPRAPRNRGDARRYRRSAY